MPLSDKAAAAAVAVVVEAAAAVVAAPEDEEAGISSSRAVRLAGRSRLRILSWFGFHGRRLIGFAAFGGLW
jgi:C4-dicarboxylate transporter